MKSISPNIFVQDIDETIKFYEKIGFELTTTVPDEGEIVWAMMTNGKVTFMFQTFDSLKNELPEISRNNGGSLLLYIEVENIEKLFDRLKDEVEIIKDLEKAFYGAMEFSIKDINNYVLTFAENEK
ncbi:VOC family protein [Maribacter sp. 2210JD10-5]|uniref:VOC family protein n=1 Tax=Maribacter sp. 2210JD10-5 TaxID=3386272 RepID=UPI0039BCFBA6